MKKILVMNGPNLNLTGIRKKNVYGDETLEDINRELAAYGEGKGVQVDFYQSNHEGALIDKIHASRTDYDGVVLNAGAYTHTSVAIHDAIKGANVPVIEVHISNVHAREAFRHHSYISPVAKGIIVGLGVRGYELAIDALEFQRDETERELADLKRRMAALEQARAGRAP